MCEVPDAIEAKGIDDGLVVDQSMAMKGAPVERLALKVEHFPWFR